MNEREAKEKFARLLLKEPGNAFAIALKVCPDDVKRAVQIANEWPNDPDVLDFQERIKGDEGENEFLPTKADLARETWNLMHDKYTDASQFAKLGKLYADLMGFIEKPKVEVNTNVQNVTNKVMIVREAVSDAEWERKLFTQQTALTHAAG